MEQIESQIPPPPQESRQEIEKVIKQYYDRYNSDELQFDLDENPDDLFVALLARHNIENTGKYIRDLNKRIIPTIKQYKKHFQRRRPSTVAQSMDIQWEGDEWIMDSTNSESYPSGHTCQAYYVAHHLSRIYPDLREELTELAEQIAQSRIDRGVHFPSDLEGGRLLAQQLFDSEINGGCNEETKV